MNGSFMYNKLSLIQNECFLPATGWKVLYEAAGCDPVGRNDPMDGRGQFLVAPP